MIKPTVKRNLMLDFIQDDFICPETVDLERVYKLNNKGITISSVIYISTREHRLEDNWGLIYSYELAKKLKQDLKVIIYLNENYYSKKQKPLMLRGIESFKHNLKKNDIDVEIVENNLFDYLKNAGAVIVDFNPVHSMNDFFESLPRAVFEVDSHNIIPARFISDKQEFSAAHLRRKVYSHISRFLTEYPAPFNFEKNEAYQVLDNFVENKLDSYDEFKNNPNKDVTSKLSPYMHFGQISSQRIAIEVLKSKASRQNKESFLEELVVRKELSDNFCLYNKTFKSLEGAPNWAKETLNSHKSDIRAYVYSLEEFESVKTHDELWNKAQKILVNEGYMHGFLRMYWAKKILEWAISPEEAVKIAVYLNDTYALDGTDPNGYVGILWSIGGLHDRPFSNRMVTGKIRYMSLGGCQKKFDVEKYINS